MGQNIRITSIIGEEHSSLPHKSCEQDAERAVSLFLPASHVGEDGEDGGTWEVASRGYLRIGHDACFVALSFAIWGEQIEKFEVSEFPTADQNQVSSIFQALSSFASFSSLQASRLVIPKAKNLVDGWRSV